MKKLVALCLLIFCPSFVAFGSNYVTYSLPYGVTMYVPRMYKVLNQKENEVIDTATLNYQKGLEYFLKPITEKIISSFTKH